MMQALKKFFKMLGKYLTIYHHNDGEKTDYALTAFHF